MEFIQPIVLIIILGIIVAVHQRLDKMHSEALFKTLTGEDL